MESVEDAVLTGEAGDVTTGAVMAYTNIFSSLFGSMFGTADEKCHGRTQKLLSLWIFPLWEQTNHCTQLDGFSTESRPMVIGADDVMMRSEAGFLIANKGAIVLQDLALSFVCVSLVLLLYNGLLS